MNRTRTSLALAGLLALFVAPARTQQPDTTLWARLRFRFVGPEGNRASAIVGEPGNPMVVYIGAASGGVWKTEDGGVQWRPVFDSEPAQAIGALAVAPSAHNVVWAGTGETFIIRSLTAIGNGVYKSTDAGRSWNHMGLDSTGRVGRIVIHPTNPDVVYACALGRAFGPAPDRGVYRTTDGGKTWTRVLFVDPNTGCADLAMDPGDPNVLFAGMWQLEIKTWNLKSGGPGSGLWVTRDGGATWKRLAGHGLPEASHAVGKIAVAVAPSDPNRVYTLIEDTDPSLYRSDDAGATWRLVTRNHDMAERAPYYVRFAVSPDDPDRLYFVTVRFSVSLDGGASLVRSGFGAGGDNHDIWVDPLNADRYLIAHDGGASMTLNRGKSYTRVVLPIAQMYHVFTDTKVPYNLYGNRQDDGSYRMPSISLSGGISEGLWQAIGGCESGFGVPDTVDNATVWSGCYDGGLEVYDVRTRHALSPHDHTHVYAGSQVVHLTTDGGASWKVISPDLTRNDTTHQQSSGGVSTDNLMTFDGANLLAIAESPLEAGVIWTGSNDGLVQVTRDGGAHWTNVSANIPKMPAWAKIVVIEPSHLDKGAAYIAVDAHELDDLTPYIYKTTDYGKTWRKITDTFPRSAFSFVHTVCEDPVRRGLLYAGTENGLFVTFDDGARWLPLQTNLPHAPVVWITVQPKFHDLVIATYGRGFYILDDVGPLEQIDAAALARRATLFPPRPAYRFRDVQGVVRAPGSAIQAQNPPYGAGLTYSLSAALADTATTPDTTRRQRSPRIVILGAGGDTVRTLEATRQLGLNRVWWDLRYAAPTTPRLRTPPPGKSFVRTGTDGTRPLVAWDLDLSTRGPLVPPGTYTVRLTVGDTTLSQQLTVLKDPNTTASDADVAAQVQLTATIRGEQDSVARMIDRLEWVRRQLQDLAGQVRGDSTIARDSAARRIGRLADSLDRKGQSIEAALFDVHLTGAREDAFRNPTQLYERLAALQSDVAENSSDFAPTSQQVAVNDLFRQRIADASGKFADFMTKDLPAFSAELRAASLKDVIAAKLEGGRPPDTGP
ncbi:MAG: glycosyl hydrolase [Gemmatimonadetes bacterium]|nr:MAG: glycosyl hydrolase [Gemmatimonadota bacterium]